MHKAFFLDRDGTLNVDYNFVHKPEQWSWCEGALDGIRWMNERNYKVIVVTNQSGISRNRFTEDQVYELHRWVDRQLAGQGLRIDDWYVAPWHPKYDADDQFDPEDRKPGTGMFKKASEDHAIDLGRSYMAGDKISDLKPAVKLKITPFFIRSRHEPDQDSSWLAQHGIQSFDNIKEAVETL